MTEATDSFLSDFQPASDKRHRDCAAFFCAVRFERRSSAVDDRGAVAFTKIGHVSSVSQLVRIEAGKFNLKPLLPQRQDLERSKIRLPGAVHLPSRDNLLCGSV